MIPLGICQDERFKRHRTGPGHPECPARLDAVGAGLEDAGVLAHAAVIQPEPIDRGALEARHDPVYVRRFEQACQAGQPVIDVPDCTISRASFEIALLAAGGVVAAVGGILSGAYRRAFCAVRPPGHHAEPDRAMGFCMFNNVALAADAARRAGIERVLILDWDVHHGNGTQHMFYHDPSVYYISLHGHPEYLFPGTGLAEEIGEGEARGTTLNLPLMPGATDDDARAAFRESVMPAVRSFEPEFVLLSTGFDAHRDDPLGILSWTDAVFEEMLTQVLELADHTAEGRVLSVLEGGYDPAVLRRCTAAHVRRLAQ